MSLPLIDALALARDEAVLAEDGGTSTLVNRLPDRRPTAVTALDRSNTTIETWRRRVGVRAAASLFCADVLEARPPASLGPWRAGTVLQFPIDTPGRATHPSVMGGARASQNVVIRGPFAADGPDRCSGLHVGRSGSEDLNPGFGARLEILARRTPTAPLPGDGR